MADLRPSTTPTGLTEKQDAALRFLAIVDRKHVAQVRRDALRAYADEALRDPHVAAAVTACLRYRRERGIGRPVTTLRSIKAARRG